jgi:hypothetical protein
VLRREIKVSGVRRGREWFLYELIIFEIHRN